jgi:DNA-binding transcriptional LysR family regulator
MAQLKTAAPNVRLVTTSYPVDEMESALKHGALDLAVDCHSVNSAGLYQQKLFDDEFVCLVRKGHPEVRGAMTRDQFVNLPHAVNKHGLVPGLIEQLLTKSGVRREAVVTFPHCLLAPFIASRTDLIVVVPKREALDFVEILPLDIFPPPVPLSRFPVRAIWSEEGHRDPANRWLRATIKEICSSVRVETAYVACVTFFKSARLALHEWLLQSCSLTERHGSGRACDLLIEPPFFFLPR